MEFVQWFPRHCRQWMLWFVVTSDHGFKVTVGASNSKSRRRISGYTVYQRFEMEVLADVIFSSVTCCIGCCVLNSGRFLLTSFCGHTCKIHVVGIEYTMERNRNIKIKKDIEWFVWTLAWFTLESIPVCWNDIHTHLKTYLNACMHDSCWLNCLQYA